MSAGGAPHWSVAAWRSIAGLRHGFFGRLGGTSTGAFATLNCSAAVGDDPARVEANLAAVRAVLSLEGLALARQVHGDRVLEVSAPGLAGEGDALVTASAGVAVGVLTADCVPILLIAPSARLAAAVHAGWKGTALATVRRALERLCGAGGLAVEGVHAALGPSIGPCCYEVGPEVAEALASGLGDDLAAARRGSGGRSWIDLRAVNAALLERAGVPRAQIHAVGPCTRCEAGRLFSHRGSGGLAGRQLSGVGWV